MIEMIFVPISTEFPPYASKDEVKEIHKRTYDDSQQALAELDAKLAAGARIIHTEKVKASSRDQVVFFVRTEIDANQMEGKPEYDTPETVEQKLKDAKRIVKIAYGLDQDGA